MTDPFSACQSLDEIMAVIYDQLGPEGLGQLVDSSAEVLCRQDLQETADALAAAGLIEAAELVRNAAEQAPIARLWRSRQQHQAAIESGHLYWGGTGRGQATP